MAGRLKDRVAIVVGAGSSGPGWGNGKCTAVTFAREGARVFCVDRLRAAAEETVGLILKEGGEAAAFECDATNNAQVKATVDACVAKWGRVDILDNNVGIGSKGSVVEESEDAWHRVMSVNVDSMFLTCKHAIPAMKASGGGAIVNVSSISALRPRGLTTYTVSKGAVIALTKALAKEVGSRGIRVNCVAPGYISTELTDVLSEEIRDVLLGQTPLGRLGEPEDIARTVRFLLSDDASFITGAVLSVDGGLGM